MNVHVIYHLLKIAMETDILCFTTFSNVLKLWVYFWQKHLLDVIFITNFWDAHLSSQYRKMMFLKLSQTWQILMKPWLIIAITSINMASLFTFLCCTFRRNADCYDRCCWLAGQPLVWLQVNTWCWSQQHIPTQPKQVNSFSSKPRSHGALVSLRTCNCIHHPGNHQSFF